MSIASEKRDSPLPSPMATPTASDRRPPPLGTPKKQVAGTVGGMVAGCAVVCCCCCCCPCAIIEFIVLVTVKIPAGLYRRVKRARSKKRIEQMKKKMGVAAVVKSLKENEEEWEGAMAAVQVAKPKPKAEEIEAMEKEMHKKFYGAGFWRSPSQRDLEANMHLLE